MWNPLVVWCKYFLTVTGIFLKARFRGVHCIWNCLNIYAPYLKREIFWDQVVSNGLFNLCILVIAGDLNFTLSYVEV